MIRISEKIYKFVLYIKNKIMPKRKPKQEPSYMLFIFGDFDDIVGLSLTLPEQYADNAVWLMNRASGLKTVATMVGLDGQPIFRRGGVGNGGTEPVLDTIYGYRVVTSAHMPSIGNGTFPVIFGDLSGVLLAESAIMSVLIDEVSQAKDAKTRFVGRTRFGCDVIRPHYLRALKCQ